MNENIIGPVGDTFLELYLEHHYRKAKRIQSRAKGLGVSLEHLAKMARENVETIDFNLNLLQEQQNGN